MFSRPFCQVLMSPYLKSQLGILHGRSMVSILITIFSAETLNSSPRLLISREAMPNYGAPTRETVQPRPPLTAAARRKEGSSSSSSIDFT